MACDFTPYSTVFQSYQDNGRLIMKGCVNGTPLRLRRIRLEQSSNLRPVGQRLPTELPGLLESGGGGKGSGRVLLELVSTDFLQV